ncbi:hypothetical protein [Roseateles sp.]|jgi:hypothetical protein
MSRGYTRPALLELARKAGESANGQWANGQASAIDHRENHRHDPDP